MANSKEENKAAETVSEEPQASDLLDKDFETIFLSMLKWQKEKWAKI